MLNTIFAKKIEMKQWFDAAGRRLGVTVLSILPATEIGSKTVAKHGYEAKVLQIQTSNRKSQTKEVRNAKEADFLVGDEVQITGISKGKGFAGVVKRYHFAGGPRTHGQSDRERAPGSIGSTTTPGRARPGKRMAGRMGNARVTVSGLKIVAVDAQKKQVLVSGAVPGAKQQLVRVVKV